MQMPTPTPMRNQPGTRERNHARRRDCDDEIYLQPQRGFVSRTKERLAIG